MTEELKPCPFCHEIEDLNFHVFSAKGFESVYFPGIKLFPGESIVVSCESCDAQGPRGAKDMKEAINTWNNGRRNRLERT